MQNNIYDNSELFGANIVYKLFPEVLIEVQEYISKNYSTVLQENPNDNRELLKSYIEKYLDDKKIGVLDTPKDELSELIFGEMMGFSFLTKYLYRTDIEEININRWDDVKIIYSNGDVLPPKEKFHSVNHAIDVMRRILNKSGNILDNARPYVIGSLSNKIRITSILSGIIDKEAGVCASIRLVNPKKLKKEEFVSNGTGTAEMLEILALFFRHGISMCVTGATSSGKTTLMSFILDQIPLLKRLITIEKGCREFDCVKRNTQDEVINNVIHMLTKESDDPNQTVTMIKLLELALTMHPHFLVVSEMKSEESLQAIKAANTGHTSLTTIHANGCEDTYYRMSALCKETSSMDDNTLMDMATRGFPIVVFTKQLEDGSRRIMEIAECESTMNAKPIMRTLFRFNITDNKIIDGKSNITGYFEKVNNPSKKFIKSLFDNGMSFTDSEKFFGNGGI